MTSGTMTGVHVLMAMTAVASIVFFLSQHFAVRCIAQLSRQQGAKSAALGVVFLLFEVLLAAGVLRSQWSTS